jgi:transposase
MTETKAKKYTYFVGIDVSRNELDFAVQQGNAYLFHKEIPNETSAITGLVEEIKCLPKFMMSKAIFCMENTGIYNNIILSTLKKFKANIVQENPLHLRNSFGNIRAKHDKVDAIRIAQYAYRHREELRLWAPKRKIIQQLAYMSSLRFRLTAMQVALKNPLHEQKDFLKKGAAQENVKLCKRILASIVLDIQDLDKRIAECIKADEQLKALCAIVTSVTSIGIVTAVQMIIHTNEFKDITTAKKFACYAGVAPFKDESGLLLKRAKVSHIANKKMKALLHICAIGALRCDAEIKAYYERKVAEGKPKMAVINAIRFKLINRVYACVNQNRIYQKNYSVNSLKKENLEVTEMTI